MGLLNKQSPREVEAQKNREQQIHGAAQQSMFGKDGELRPEYLQELVGHGIDESTAMHLRNMLSKDFVLANLEGAEVDELKWLTRVQKQKILSMHPPEESAIQGEYRKFIHDDQYDGLSALNDDDKTKIDQVIFDVHVRTSRSKGGWQQEEFGKTINVSELKNDNDKQSGGLF